MGLRTVTARGSRTLLVALATAEDGLARFTLMDPLDVNGDGRMEILIYDEGWEENQRLRGFTFDGRRIREIPW